MPDIKIDSVFNLVMFMFPGMIMVFIRNKFLVLKNKSHSDLIIDYLFLSIMYYGLAFLFIPVDYYYGGFKIKEYFKWFILIFVGPIILSFLEFLLRTIPLKHSKRMRRIWLRYFNHSIPSAWDYVARVEGVPFVIISLKGGDKIYGRYAEGTFISTDPSERDIYVSELYKFNEEDGWKLVDGGSIYISKDQIETIEFRNH